MARPSSLSICTRLLLAYGSSIKGVGVYGDHIVMLLWFLHLKICCVGNICNILFSLISIERGMTSRGQAPGMMRHGPFPGLGSGATHRLLEPLPPPELMENKIAAQVAEIERLTRENQRLATTHVTLRQDLVATQKELQRLEAHIGSIQTESDIQIRLLLDKIKKIEVDIRAAESMKKEVQQAHKEAQSLITTRQELGSEIKQATQDLQKAHAEVEQLPELHAELNKLRQEYHRLRASFEYEKGLNLEKVEQLHTMEKNLIAMAREVEKLCAELFDAEKRAHAPYLHDTAYVKPESSYPPPIQGGGTYMNGYGMTQSHMGGGVAGNGVNLYRTGGTASSNSVGGGGFGAAIDDGGNDDAASS
ncbi:hypothetical protein AQUCO_03100054v1 [Aquilegia coerulea]|uniref:Protein FLX-like 4 n=1 Tax=Aquilegia coerulea TaxID=218851 RepID=A0A2G5D0J3_AQUCA|nr:hypothetical protein AQUCO_03100054v1 [Aquilegia coerulea]